MSPSMHLRRRVVVTGLGALTPIGSTVKEFWTNALAGVSGAGPITRFDASNHDVKFAAEVKGFDPTNYGEKKEVKKMDRFTQFAIAAAQLAVVDSGLDVAKVGERAGVLIGSGIGGIETLEDQHTVLMEKGPRRVSPFFIPMMIVNIASGLVSMRFGAKGPSNATVTACASGANAIGDAYRILQYGDADVMIAGGAEAPISPISVSGFASLRALSTRNEDPAHASRPFEKDRDGFVIGEGAGVVILEEREHALARGARIYCEVVGYGYTSDAYHMTAPSPEHEGAGRAMQRVLQDASLQPSDVDYVNAHGTSTPLNDRFETMAIRRVFGDHATKLAVSSTKSMTGHLLGAAGGIEFVILALTHSEGKIPPTINYETPDPELLLDFVPNKARELNVEVAISNSFGFGGHNVTLATRKHDG